MRHPLLGKTPPKMIKEASLVLDMPFCCAAPSLLGKTPRQIDVGNRILPAMGGASSSVSISSRFDAQASCLRSLAEDSWTHLGRMGRRRGVRRGRKRTWTSRRRRRGEAYADLLF